MSNQYQNDIVEFVEEYKKSIVFIKGISHNDVKITAEELKSIYEKFSKFPLKERFEHMINSVCHTLGLPRKKYFNSIKKTLLESSNINFDCIKSYQLFLTAYNIEKTDNFKKDKINYEDITGLLYIYFSINGYPNYNYIKQIVIDEVQDYTPFQLSLIKRIFKNAAFTILGDINQGINPYQRYNSLADLKDIYDGKAKYIELTKTYRSSEEIIDYTNTILGINNVCSVRHNNNIPVDIKDVPDSEILRVLKEDIINMDKLGMGKIAIITRDVEQAKKLYLHFKNSKMDIQLIACSDSKIIDSKIIIPSYLSKGLEFDGVIVYNNPDKPFTEEEGNLYYVVCTRAQHKLNVYNEPRQLILNRL
ncbi:MAG: AAA family ATPase [Bacilli bacterium]|nr:AAA family ATPase [Bacilli bacterium]